MEQESSDELLGLQRHDLLFVPSGVIPPSEGNRTVLESKDTVIADGDSVGISAQILKDPLGTVEGRFAIDDPFLMIKLSSEAFKGMRLFQMRDTAGEDELARFKTIFKIVQKLASKQGRQNPYGDEEVFPARYPPAFVRGQTTAGNDTVDMGMVHQVLSPGMENAYETDLCAKMLRIIGEFYQRLGDTAEQEVVHDFLIHNDKGIQL